MKKVAIIKLFTLSLSMFLAACGGNPSSEPLAEAAQEALQEAADETPQVATPEIDDLTAEDNAECLLGTWSADLDSLQEYLTKAMNISEDVKFNITLTSGQMLWSFDGDDLYFDDNEPIDMVIEIVANDTPLGTSNLSMVPVGHAEYVLLGNLIATNGVDYEIDADANFELDVSSMMTTSTSITLTPGHFAASIDSLEEEVQFESSVLNPNDYGGFAIYDCIGNKLVIKFGDHELKFSKFKELGE